MKSIHMKAKYFKKDIIGERAYSHPLAGLVYPLKLIIASRRPAHYHSPGDFLKQSSCCLCVPRFLASEASELPTVWITDVVGNESMAMESGLRVSRRPRQKLVFGDKLYATCSPVSEPLEADMTDALGGE